MSQPAINLTIERLVIDEAVHRAGPETIRAALESQLPALLAASTSGICISATLSQQTVDRTVGRLRSSTRSRIS